jgi:hypothetical protein
MVADAWGPPPAPDAVSDAWLLGSDRAEREAYVQHLDARMWAVVFPRGVPRQMVHDDALMRRADRELAGPLRVLDRYLWGQASKADYQVAMVAVKEFWEREFRQFRLGTPL